MWENFDLRNAEDALPLMTVEDVDKAASKCKTTTRVEGDGFHPEVPLDLSGDKCGRSLTLLHKVRIAGVWPTTSCILLVVLIPKSAASEQPATLFPALNLQWVWLGPLK